MIQQYFLEKHIPWTPVCISKIEPPAHFNQESGWTRHHTKSCWSSNLPRVKGSTQKPIQCSCSTIWTKGWNYIYSLNTVTEICCKFPSRSSLKNAVNVSKLFCHSFHAMFSFGGSTYQKFPKSIIEIWDNCYTSMKRCDITVSCA